MMEEKAMEFKVGDRVGITVEGDVTEVRDTIARVKDEDGTIFSFYKEHLNKIITPKSFTKDDLRDGMVITDREGEEAIIFKNQVHYQNSAPEELEDYNDDLTFKQKETSDYEFCKDLDIMQVKQGNVVLFERPKKKGTLTVRYHFMETESILTDLKTILSESKNEEIEITVKNLEV